MQRMGPTDCVIGCNGTAGSLVVKALLAEGRSVRAVDFEDPRKQPADKFGPVPAGAALELLQVGGAKGT